MTPELSSFSDGNKCWEKIKLGENKPKKVEGTSSELEEELLKSSAFCTGGSQVPFLKSGRLKLLGDYQIKYYCNGEDRTEASLTHAPLTQIRFFFWCEMKGFRINCGKK